MNMLITTRTSAHRQSVSNSLYHFPQYQKAIFLNDPSSLSLNNIKVTIAKSYLLNPGDFRILRSDSS